MDKEELNNIVCQSSSDYKILDGIYNYIEKLERLQQKNTNLKQALNEIREYCNYNNEELYTCESDYDYEEELELNYNPSSFREDILQIIDKVLGGSDE